MGEVDQSDRVTQTNKPWSPKKCHRVCSRHFVPYPTEKLGYTNAKRKAENVLNGSINTRRRKKVKISPQKRLNPIVVDHDHSYFVTTTT